MVYHKSSKKIFQKRFAWIAPFKKLFKIAGVGFVLLIIFSFFLFVYFIKDLPRPERFSEGVIAQSSKIYDRTGKVLLYEIAGEEKRTFVKLSEIPDYLKWAVISVEDAKFYTHKGLDFRALLRAVLYDLKLGKFAQGASTISQQLIRSYFLSTQKTLTRKTREIVLTLELERRYSKDQILEWYLNLIPFGGNIYGVEAASESFFGKKVSEISLGEAAVLAALIRSPSYLSPYGSHLNDLLIRKNYVLERMWQEGYISKKEKEKAQKAQITFLPPTTTIKAPHFVMYVKQYLEKKYGREFLNTRGLKIQTTLDFTLQEKAQEIIKNKLKELSVYNAHNAGLVAVNPQTGEILAMVGSKDFFASPYPEECSPGKDCLFDPQVNTTLSLRQPGSAFKPIVYAAAFEKGFTPKTILWDVKTEFNPNCPIQANKDYDKYNQKCYHPKNYDDRYAGPINLKNALAQSRNIPAVKLLYLTGLDNALKMAERLGISTLKDKQRYGLSLVLGGGEVRLLDMVSAYSVFAADGVKSPLYFIKKIEDTKGNIIEKERPTHIKTISSQIARQINDILSDNNARAPMFGLNSALYIKGYKVAAKTGTTQEYKDAWTIGYTPSIAIGVWVGNNNNTPMAKKPAVVMAGYIWKEMMSFALSFTTSSQEFKKPQPIKTNKKILDGEIEKPFHSILYYIKKEDPLGEKPLNPQKDPLYFHFEWGIKDWLKSHSL